MLWFLRGIFLVFCGLITIVMGVLGFRTYKKDSKYLANILCSASFFSLSCSTMIYLLTLLGYMISSFFSAFLYKLLFVFIILTLFLLSTTLAVFFKGPNFVFLPRNRIFLLIEAGLSFILLFLPINFPMPPDYSIWTREFTITLVIFVGFYSLLILFRYVNVYQQLSGETKHQFSIFGFGIFLLLIGLYFVIYGMNLSSLFALILGYLLLIMAVFLLYRGISNKAEQ